MIALSKMADHGVTVAVAMTQAVKTNSTAAELAEVTALPLPTVAKILKQLTHGGVVTSLRGVKGGYRLSERPQNITVWQIMVAIDGDFSLTECSSHPNSAGQTPHECSRSPICQVRPQWQKIDEVITAALKKITLYEMMPLNQRLLIEPLQTSRHRANSHNPIQSGFTP